MGEVVEVVLGALVRDGQVLLALRGPTKRAYPGIWELPGGCVEGGESELEALARELREELGVRIEASSASPLGAVTARPSGHLVHLSAWLVVEWEGTPVNGAPEEHDDIAWFGLDVLPPTPHTTVREALVKAMERY